MKTKLVVLASLAATLLAPKAFASAAEAASNLGFSAAPPGYYYVPHVAPTPAPRPFVPVREKPVQKQKAHRR